MLPGKGSALFGPRLNVPFRQPLNALGILASKRFLEEIRKRRQRALATAREERDEDQA